MKKYSLILALSLSILSLPLLESCSDDNGFGGEVTIPDFDFATTVNFEQSLSAYQLFQGNPQNLIPENDVQVLELSSILFTDYAHKQRLVKLPSGEQMTRNADGSLNFPDSTILAKTFFYYNDERDTTLGKRIIETRLLIKNDGIWNVATYLWDNAQSEATLELNGFDTPVDWITTNGISRSTMYHVPDENECIACHQSNQTLIPLGTTLRNLNHEVVRNNSSLNQITHLQTVGLFNNFGLEQINQIVDYNDLSVPLADRARAYLDINCSHCHNPTAWEESADQDLDFRYDTPLNQTSIVQEADEIEEMISNGEMPFIGTTIPDDEGIDLIIQYLNSL